MKKVYLLLIAVIANGMLSAQFAGIQNNQEQPLPAGFKPASTNTFLSQYPAINAETCQATFRVVAPYAQNVTLQLGGKHSMTKDDKGVWWYTTETLVEYCPCSAPVGRLSHGENVDPDDRSRFVRSCVHVDLLLAWTVHRHHL